MNNYLSGGQVLSAGVSVLPATGAYALLSQSQIQSLTAAMVLFVGVWALSYVVTSGIMRLIKN